MTDPHTLPAIADQVHSAVVRASWGTLDKTPRDEWRGVLLEKFRAEATARGLTKGSGEMSFVVLKCLALSGFGS